MLYHRDVYLPPVRLPAIINLDYGYHSLERALVKYNISASQLPSSLENPQDSIIEMEMEVGLLEKIVCRIPFDNDRDLVLAIQPGRPNWFVRTVWLNRRADKHSTLNTSRYAGATT